MKKEVNSAERPKADKLKNIAVIVAHPDDETLWAGGTILNHYDWQVFVLSLCRGDDADRAPKFKLALKTLRAKGAMGCLDDGVQQTPLTPYEIQNTILNLLPAKVYDLVITHNPSGEYTYHRRHIEVSEAVINMWKTHQIRSKELWTFAYYDGEKKFYPRANKKAPIRIQLTLPIYDIKYEIINKIYGYPKEGWEACTTPSTEAFWSFKDPEEAVQWLEKGGVLE
ncbi:LmbE family protein [Pseudopedobacter saltans DSM 12145]|uniref:LmbE family protein n=1 Tax=Pseudopedobacter saltans (strain ATCC 51119 / DSM 12145 / JCM 21818 / CCUG 39354 / LMG 10337 / NBRC 100064 / NCIMB 13643) TaxID=762903 RepID=F0S862_PSESL|nr:PIG-L family deacetylase [Pseudopedobacter saltans]ADY52324.1 LmbE family protein [Pseudopedobacter saltans DSM 12145]